MAKLSDIYKLRQEMKILQSEVMSLYKRGCSFEEISKQVDAPVKSVRVIVAWLTRRECRQ